MRPVQSVLQIANRYPSEIKFPSSPNRPTPMTTTRRILQPLLRNSNFGDDNRPKGKSDTDDTDTEIGVEIGISLLIFDCLVLYYTVVCITVT